MRRVVLGYSIGLMLLVGMGMVSSATAKDWGGDLLNGAGTFEDQGSSGTGPWTFYTNPSSGGPVSELSTNIVRSGNYAWHGGDTTSGGQQARVYYNDIATIGNREHMLVVYGRQNGSSPSWFRYTLGSSGEQSLGLAWTVFAASSGYYTTAADETSLDLSLRMYSNSAGDNVYADDVALYREAVTPWVGSDSVNRELKVGAATDVVFYANSIPDPNMTIMFDPDIVITATNATVSNTVWLSDTAVQTTLTAVSAGDVDVMLQNVYSQKSFTYPMVAGLGDSCGAIGGVYPEADITGAGGARDCYVDLADFGSIAGQWLECTDLQDPQCSGTW